MTALLVLIYIAFISLGLPDTILGSAWPVMGPELGQALSRAGLLSAITSVCTVISSALSVRFIARFGTGRVTAVSVAMTAGALIGVGFAPGFGALCLLAVPLGLGGGSVDAALNNFVALHYKARHMSWLHCFWGVGATAGPLIMALWLSAGNWRGGYMSIGAVQACLALVMIATLGLWKKAAGPDGEAEPPPRALTIRETLSRKGAAASFLSTFCYCALEASTGLWGASYMTGRLNMSAQSAAAWMSGFFVGITAGRFLCGILASRYSDRALIRMGQAAVLLGVLTLFVTPALKLPPVALILIGLGCAPIFPSILHRTPAVFGAEDSQAMTGMEMACAYIGSTLTPPLFGLIAQYVSISLLPVFQTALLLIMLLATERVNKLSPEDDRD